MKKFTKILLPSLFIFIVGLLFLFNKNFIIGKYIKENNRFEMIDVNKYDVFLIGENHTFAKSEKFKKDIFTYLNKKANVKIIIEEMGFCQALLLNEYIESGNEEYLRSFMSQLKGTMAYTREKYEFYKWLYKYNLKLDEDSKIRIYGVDVEHDSLAAIKGIKVLIDKNKAVPKSLQKAITILNEDNVKSIKYFKLAYDENKKDCEKFFGDKFIYFENGIKNLYAGGSGEDKRDKIMMRNFSFVYSQHKDEKFFGQFGGEHIYQDYINTDYLTDEEVRFATLLNGSYSPVKNKVYSLLCVYENKEGNSPYENNFDYSYFKNIKEDTFIELNGKNSPFKKKEYLFKGSKKGKVTCDYVQGIMLLKNSKKTQTYY